MGSADRRHQKLCPVLLAPSSWEKNQERSSLLHLGVPVRSPLYRLPASLTGLGWTAAQAANMLHLSYGPLSVRHCS